MEIDSKIILLVILVFILGNISGYSYHSALNEKTRYEKQILDDGVKTFRYDMDNYSVLYYYNSSYSGNYEARNK